MVAGFSQGVGAGRGSVCSSPLEPPAHPSQRSSALSSTLQPGYLVLSACRVPGTVVTKAGEIFPGG